MIGMLLATSASPVAALDLWNIYQLALENDPSFQADRITYQADQRVVDQARALLRPSVSVGADQIYRRQSIDGRNGGADRSDSDNFSDLSLFLSQSIYDKPLRLGVGQSKEQAKLAALTLADSRQNLITRSAQRYFDVLAAIDNHTVAVSEKKAIARQLDLAKERYDVGLGTKTDLFESRARFKLAEADEISALNLINNAQQALIEIIGQIANVDELAKLADDAPISLPEPNDVEQWLMQARSDNLAVKIQQQNAEVARLEVDIQRAAQFPVVEITARESYDDARLTPTTGDTESRQISLRFDVPLYTGGLINSRTQESAFRYSAALKDSESALRATERAARSTFLDITSSANRVSALFEAITASESAVTAKEEGFAAGVDTNIDVLDAQRDLFGATRDFLQARYDHILLLLSLEQVAGDLDDEDIRRVNAWLVR
jgi:outer membrane protein